MSGQWVRGRNDVQTTHFCICIFSLLILKVYIICICFTMITTLQFCYYLVCCKFLGCHFYHAFFVSIFLKSLRHHCFAGGGVQSQGHHTGDSHQHQGIQAHQAAGAAGGAHHREAGEATETGGGAQEATEAPGVPQCSPAAWPRTQVSCGMGW